MIRPQELEPYPTYWVLRFVERIHETGIGPFEVLSYSGETDAGNRFKGFHLQMRPRGGVQRRRKLQQFASNPAIIVQDHGLSRIQMS